MPELKTYKIVIPGRLPGLNDYINALNTNRHAGAKLKRDYQTDVMWMIRQQMGARKIKHPVFVRFRWVECDRRRDRDNISAFGRKVILDALVSCGTIQDDGWDFVTGLSDRYAISKSNPRIEVELVEQEDGEGGID